MFWTKPKVNWFNRVLSNTPAGLLIAGVCTGLGAVAGQYIGQRLLEGEEKPAPQRYRERELI